MVVCCSHPTLSHSRLSPTFDLPLGALLCVVRIVGPSYGRVGGGVGVGVGGCVMILSASDVAQQPTDERGSKKSPVVSEG